MTNSTSPISHFVWSTVTTAVLLGMLFTAGCSDSSDSGGSGSAISVLTGCAETDSCFSNPSLVIGGERPAQVRIPSDYTTSTRYPLIIVLHGYAADGAIQAEYMGLDERADSQQYVLVKPDGTANTSGTRFWNATPACCAKLAARESGLPDDEYLPIDDVAYIRGLIEEAAATYSLDYQRIGLIGHSNGGFMALRMACEASDIVTSVVSLAGSTFENSASCTPATEPVSVLALHGDVDAAILYEGGGDLTDSYPGAMETVKRFALLADCDTSNTLSPPNIDVIGSIEGAETEVLSYAGCSKGSEVELWTIVDGPHIPFPWVDDALDTMVAWTIGHPRK